MTSLDVTGASRRPFSGRRLRLGDLILQGVAGIAALGSLVLVGLITWKVIEGARLSISTFGLSFVWTVAWDPVHNQFGAGSFLFGTAVTSFGALLIATPIAIGVALFLSELAPRGIRGPVTALVDGNTEPPEMPCPVRCIVEGDASSISIAAASIVAKVTRDREMVALAGRYPGYGWERNMGYGTPEHRLGIDCLGINLQHRRTFRPIYELLATSY